MNDIGTRNARALNYIKEKQEEKRDRILLTLTILLATPLILSFTFIVLSTIFGWQL